MPKFLPCGRCRGQGCPGGSFSDIALTRRRRQPAAIAFHLPLALDTQNRVWQRLEPRKRDGASALLAQTVLTFAHPAQSILDRIELAVFSLGQPASDLYFVWFVVIVSAD
jgi:hypothetical protein